MSQTRGVRELSGAQNGVSPLNCIVKAGPSTFTPGDEVIMMLRRDISGRPLGGFVGAKLGDGTTIGRWEE